MQYVDVDNDPATWNSSSADLLYSNENGASNSCTKIIYAGLYWTGRTTADGAATSPHEFTVTKNINGTTITKNFNKRKISLKGPGANNYSNFQANEHEIYYPKTNDAFIYSAYVEVTDYVRVHGMGTYWAADIALVEGNGSSTGYSGGWGLVVIYENSKMKHRDITVFDGHAFVLNSNFNGYEMAVNGFHTLRNGIVGAKLGYMASEGDVGLDGDFFQIQKHSDSSFLNLQHALNNSDNFFNSSNTTPIRNPSFSNNTGIDIGTFSIPNENNTVFGNNQTSTTFKYGTVGDTYAIFALVLAVDSYLPSVENTISIAAINNIPNQQNNIVLPGQEIDVNVAIRNREIESISDYKLIVPMPYNATFVQGSQQGVINYQSSAPNPGQIIYDAEIGQYGSLIWNYGHLPPSNNPEMVLANLKFKIKTTEDCFQLKASNCQTVIEINGTASGVGSISGATFSAFDFILGRETSGGCIGSAIKGPLRIPLEASSYVQAHCASTPAVRDFSYCHYESAIPVSELAHYFPPNSIFSDEFPFTENTNFFGDSAPFPIADGESLNYFAVPKNLGTACVFPFTLSKCGRINAAADQGATVNSASGGVAYPNILANDSLNGQQVLLSDVQLTIVSAQIAGITLQGTSIIVAPGTPAGNYSIAYQICDSTDASLCTQASISLTVTTIEIIANDDTYEFECSETGIIGNILINDFLNGSICLANEVNISVLDNSNANIYLNSATGEVALSQELTGGIYLLQYKISHINSPLNFSIATVNISIVDTTPPSAPQLDDLVDYCNITVPIPIATDACSGEITGFTSDPLFYDVPGEYVVHWSFADANNNITVLNQNVVIRNSDASIPGYGYVDCNLDNDISLNVNLNSFLPEGTNNQGIWTSSISTPHLSGSVFSPYLAPTGYYDFQYLFEQDDCYQSASVTIEVSNNCFVAPACTLKVHNSFSPNNDGTNELFVIENIDQISCFPTNSVEIYNRWGVLVYKTKQYDNITRVFRGISEGRATINETDKLPTGTYFYSIKYTDTKGIEHEESGYLYLVL